MQVPSTQVNHLFFSRTADEPAENHAHTIQYSVDGHDDVSSPPEVVSSAGGDEDVDPLQQNDILQKAHRDEIESPV